MIVSIVNVCLQCVLWARQGGKSVLCLTDQLYQTYKHYIPRSSVNGEREYVYKTHTNTEIQTKQTEKHQPKKTR